jgi:hypothetical protein
MSEVELFTTYHDARRRFVEEKFARDSQRARLEWQKAKLFLNSSGGVTERQYTVAASEEFGRKGQEIRELSRNLDLLKADIDIIAMIVRSRGATLPADGRTEPQTDEHEGGESA